MRNITKNIFLNAIQCPTLGWMIRNEVISKSKRTIGEQFRIDEGKYIGKQARKLFSKGVLVDDKNITVALEKTEKLMKDSKVKVIFEGTFSVNNYFTKADVLIRKKEGWQLIEVKSAVNDKAEFIDDMAYTAIVIKLSGLKLSKITLLLLSRDYRLGMNTSNLFNEIDHTEAVLDRAKAFEEWLKEIDCITSQEKCPKPKLKFECKKCEIFSECVGKDIKNHIFDIPRINKSKFDKLLNLGIQKIEDIKDDLLLTETQQKVKKCVQENKVIIEDGLKNKLDSIIWPAYYLDFESVKFAVPIYPDVVPHCQIPTQFSIHKCSGIGCEEAHFEYLADPSKDCRKELAEQLIEAMRGEGSIIIYTPYEKTVINALAKRYPKLAKALEDLISRMVDMNAIIKSKINHPDFHGKTSLKVVLPILITDMSYDDFEIADGDSALAIFAYMALGRYQNKKEIEDIRKNLLKYCKQDTFAMVRLHQCLMDLT